VQIGDFLEDGTYEIVSGPYKGGMAWVFQASIRKGPHAGAKFAIKTPHPDKDPSDVLRAFSRELDALKRLGGHPNIIRLIREGISDAGERYLILEWLERTLVDEIQQRGPQSWSEWIEGIGDALLNGLVHAHKEDRAHRDLSPRNIMFDVKNTPKICDFGCAATGQREFKEAGTLAHMGSPPFTPHDLDNGLRSRSRDCYSWAVLSACALAGRIFSNIGEVRQLLATSDPDKVPVDILSRATSDSPNDRYAVASAMLSDLKEFEFKRLSRGGESPSILMDCTPTALPGICELTGQADQRRALASLASELNQVCACELNAAVDEKITLTGSSLVISAYLKGDWILIVHAKRIGLLPAQRSRESMLVVPVQFHADGAAIRGAGKIFQAMLGEADIKRDQQKRQTERLQLLQEWSRFLEERFAKIHKERYVIRYTEVEASGDEYLLSLAGDFDLELLGSNLLVRPDATSVIPLILVRPVGDRIRVRYRNESALQLPPSGQVERDTMRDRIAIERQRRALEMVRTNCAVAHGAIDWLAHPEDCLPPEPGGVDALDGLSSDKIAILDAALGVQSVMTVAGPPGTGKTTLIVALITAYLKRYPKHRILLASQTHVAVDNAIERLNVVDPRSLVRIGSEKEERISDGAKAFLLSKRYQEWAQGVREKSIEFLGHYAKSKGHDIQEVTMALFLVELNYVEAQIADTTQKRRLAEIAAEARRVEHNKRRESQVDDEAELTNALESTSEISDLSDQLENYNRLHRDVSRQLRSIPVYGAAVEQLSKIERTEWIDALYARTPDGDHLRRLIKIQQDWLAGLSQSREFELAVLSEARLVAGTCVGIASEAFFKDSFDLCIIDEAGKATGPESLVPLSRSKRWILVGDSRQLPPYFERRPKGDDRIVSPAVRKTLLDRFEERLPEDCRHALKEQRRMCWSIGELIAKAFYSDREILNVRPDTERAGFIAGAFPKSVTWITTSGIDGSEERLKTSRRNRTEAEIIVNEVRRLVARVPKGKPLHIAVIAGYAAQVRYLEDATKNLFPERANLTIECNTVDAFQGREADVCFFSVTRSNPEDDLGFMDNPPRLNVALSRALDALVIVGDDQFCRRCAAPNPFVAVLAHIDTHPDSCSLRIYERNRSSR
jgi:hypothetical protein